MSTFFCSSIRRAQQLLAAGLLASCALPAHAQDSTLTRLIRQNQYPLVANGAQFSGAGWDKIRAAVQKSQFVLVGEDHGTAQIPVFTAAVAQVLKPALYVAEVDPYAAQALTQLTAQPGLPTAFLRRYPGALCFYSLAEEYELARAVRAQQARFVGIDQIFAFSAGYFYQQLASQVKGKAAHTYVAQRAAAYQAQDQANERRGGSTYVLTSQSPAAVDSLLAITQNESPATRQMVQDYVTSYRIYQAQIKGTGGHQERLNLMRHNLLEALHFYTAGPTQVVPKALFKFGDVHMTRGLSTISFGQFYDVGNLAQSLVEAQGQQSLHLRVTGKQGSRATGLNPTTAAKSAQPYTEADAGKEAPFLKLATGPNWSLFDLRPLQKALGEGKLQVPSQGLQRLIMGFDYLVVIPETTASRAM
jgi:hypothetical protein